MKNREHIHIVRRPFPQFAIPNSQFSIVLAACAALGAAAANAQDARIVVHADRPIATLTPYMTGACLEDVNHEVYGGIYSQMVFGESFQEPQPLATIKGFKTYGGQWTVSEGVIAVKGGEGPKLMYEGPPLALGDLSVEVFLPGQSDGVAGLIVKVSDSGIGADKFAGYEIALNSQRQVLVLGRHRQNWEPIREVPCEVPTDTWIPLTVRFGEKLLEVLVNGKSLVKYEDQEHPLPAGTIGLRPFHREARYRNLTIKTAEKTEMVPFEPVKQPTDGVSGMWRPIRTGTAEGRFELTKEKPLVDGQSQMIVFASGSGEFGIENQGLNRWGMGYVAGKPYEGYVWVRTTAPAALRLALQSRDGGKTYAERRLDVAAQADWQRLDYTLTPDATDGGGRFALTLTQPGEITVGHVFLQPGEWGRFKGLPCRKDVVDSLVAQGLTVLRYGGCMANAPEYRWKKMIGPRDRRPPYKGFWYPYSTNGWGIIEFIATCEAAGFLAIPDFQMDETPADMADFIEYVNGPADSPMGKLRAADGHPEPYHLQHIQLGNEEAVDEHYWERFKPMAEAIWAKDKDITIVVGDFAYNQPIADPYNFEGGAAVKTLATHKKILDLAAEHNREVWFDVHVWNHEPRDCDGLGGVPSYIEWLARLSPKARFKVPVFELNATNHAVRRALGNAHAINELERLGDKVPVVCSANCLQPDGQNDNGWDQGLLFLNPYMVWPQPPYFVTQMLRKNFLPQVVAANVESLGNALDVTAKVSADGKILQLQVVNVDARPLKTAIALGSFKPANGPVKVTTLTGQIDDVNTAERPDKIKSITSEWKPEYKDGQAVYEFPAYSFVILRWE